jgi:hypothetical protein
VYIKEGTFVGQECAMIYNISSYGEIMRTYGCDTILWSDI